MAPKPKKRSPHVSWRDGLGLYINTPESPAATSQILFLNPEFVGIWDLYPKASVHTLLLPRAPHLSAQHPIKALESPNFLMCVRQQVAQLTDLVVAELQRRYELANPDRSASQQQARDWRSEVMAGVHSRPSMNHLHIHVLSVDRHSKCLKHRKHYNSFSTDFFIPISDFPLGSDDPRRHPEREGYLNSDLKCWRCGKMFGKKFTELKRHLAEEYENWMRQ
ncbi:Bgt-4571 [Blumeria graminis f. sp. tritici]|uniref:Aprataxin-like protein n=3 Tax=Blumeria graminis TaxID=34373 RepID=A0A381LFV2_BLUGR|nr:hypothetical protein BGT96224_4571 [Blumeria graminis f. sp. tritici 96224]VDB93454.1 Bgt-4571 [Blumeria graminis f. sp. tritici]